MSDLINVSRRGLIRGIGAGATLAAVPAWAQGHGISGHAKGVIRPGFDEVSGTVIDLAVGAGMRTVQGRRGHGVAVNGSVPGPLVRLREGQKVRINVTNHLDEDTSIHWHGLLLPFQFDGVPGVSFPGIKPHQTFTYEFPVRQSGTYWYHSHSGLQEQTGRCQSDAKRSLPVKPPLTRAAPQAMRFCHSARATERRSL